MIAYIVTEGPIDSDLLKLILLKDLLQGVEFVVAGGISSVKSLARSLLVRRQTPVAIVIDADSVVPELIQERRRNIEEVIKTVAGNVPVKVIVAIPELEIILFEDPKRLEKIFNQPIPDEILLLAATKPGEALGTLTAQSQHIRNREEVIEALRTQDVEPLRKNQVVQELTEFLRQAHQLSGTGSGLFTMSQ